VRIPRHRGWLIAIWRIAAMTKPMAEYVRACLDRAAEAERLASQEPDRKAKAELLHLASTWRQVAADYEHVEKLEKFLETYKAPASLSEH
jgi:hypothetical protein